MRLIAYTRVSTRKQAESNLSMEAQRRKCMQFADLHEHQIVASYSDAGASAKTLERPGLSQVLEMLRAGQADGLLVAKLDRLTRSVMDLGCLLRDYFSDGQYALMCVADSIDTTSATGRLVTHVLMSVSQWEREVIAERTRDAMAELKVQGKRRSRWAPYGYTFNAAGGVVEHEVEQKTLHLMCAMSQDGAGPTSIAACLTGMGLFNRSDKPWTKQGVSRVLNAQKEA